MFFPHVTLFDKRKYVLLQFLKAFPNVIAFKQKLKEMHKNSKDFKLYFEVTWNMRLK